MHRYVDISSILSRNVDNSVCLSRDLDNVVEDEVSVLPLLFIDTAGCDMYELELPEEISKGNEGGPKIKYNIT